MKLVTGEEMRRIDSRAIAMGLPGLVLMENAGRQVAQIAQGMINSSRGEILILCGSGNNGGDGFVAARYLANYGHKVQVLIFGKGFFGAEAASHLKVLQEMNISITFISHKEGLQPFREEKYSLLIDALLGTGLLNEVRGLFAEAIAFINSKQVPVLSVDIPSGLDSDSGMVLGEAVQAQETVSFVLPKIGNVAGLGGIHTGKLHVVDIGMPLKALEEEEPGGEIIDFEWGRLNLPKRPPTSHKGTCGKILIVGGSSGMVGAPILAAKAALVAGAGLVTVGLGVSSKEALLANVLEALLLALPEDDQGYLGQGSLELVLEKMSLVDIMVLGPGLGRTSYIKELVKTIVKECPVPLLIDADGLNVLVLEDLRRRIGPTILTPHFGEMARLMKLPIESIAAAPFVAARSLAKDIGATIVLKGPNSIIAGADGYFFVNTSGNPGMATAGSGDVLAGTIAGLLGQIDNLGQGVALGTYIHGLAGDLAGQEKGQYSLLASDIINSLPKAFKVLMEDD